MRKYFRFDLKGAILFFLLQATVCITLAVVLGFFIPKQNSELFPLIAQKPVWQLLILAAIAGCEDFFLVLPVLLVGKINLSCVKWIALAAMLALVFWQHSYKGAAGAVVSVAYFTMAYFFAQRFGILTTAGVHFSNDAVALLLVKLAVHG